MRADILRRIFFAKKLYEDAEIFCRKKSDEISFAQGILLLQDSLEVFLATLCSHLDIVLPETAGMLRYIKLISDNDRTKQLRHTREMNRLNSARVTIKHQGFLVKTDELAHLPEVAYELMAKACEDYLRLPFDEISLTRLIGNPHLRLLVQKAEKEIKQQNYKECLELLAELVYNVFEIKTLPDRGLIVKALLEGTGRSSADDGAPYDIVEPYNNKLVVLLLQHEIDTHNYYEFKKLTPITGREKSTGKFKSFWKLVGGNPDAFTQENAKYCLDVAVDIALKFQRKQKKRRHVSSFPENYNHIVTPTGEVAEFYNFPKEYKQSPLWMRTAEEEPRKLIYELKKGESLEGLAWEYPPNLKEYFVLFLDKIEDADAKKHTAGFVESDKVNVFIQRRREK